MTFGAPWLLLGLAAVPAAAAGYVLLDRRRSRRSAAWSRRELLPNMLVRRSRRLAYVPAALLLLGLTFLLVGFARPKRVVDGPRGNPPSIVLAIDVSGSMASADVQPTRLRAARAIAARFVRGLPARYRVGVVTFADRAQLAVAPTLDRGEVIDSLPTAVTPLGATAIGDGVRRAVAAVVAAAGQTQRGSLVRPGAVLLLTDGAQTAGGTSLEAAAVSALVDYVPVDTVALGTPHGLVSQRIPLNGAFTSTQLSAPVDPAPLRTIAKETGGSFFDGSAVAAQPELLTAIDRRLRTYAATTRRTESLGAATAGAALLFILGGIGLAGIWFGRIA